MLGEPGTTRIVIGRLIRCIICLCFTAVAHTGARDPHSLLLSQDPQTGPALVELNVSEEQVDALAESIANELVLTLFQGEKVLERDASCHILRHLLADSGQVESAIIYNRVELWLEIVLPGHLVDIFKLKEVGSDQNVEHVLVVDF